ncbi:MAG: Hint domain-containing protein [Paracoccaceae bacterium]
MGYNIRDVGGDTTLSGGVWEATLDLQLSNATTVTGDFDEFIFGFQNGTQDTTFTFSGLSDPDFGSLSGNPDGTFTFIADWDEIRDATPEGGVGQIVSFTVTGVDPGGDSDVATVGINLLICVARGTIIATSDGPIAVEDLKSGDMILTMDGGEQPLIWTGSRKVTGAELAHDPSKRPIRFETGALGHNQPMQPLKVSPQHRMYLRDWRAQLMFGEDEVLVPAKSLVNDKTILTDNSLEEIEYFHLLFDEHQIISTNGALTESFHPGAYTVSELDSAVRDELFKLFPELQDGTGYGDTARTILRSWEAGVMLDTAEVTDSE